MLVKIEGPMRDKLLKAMPFLKERAKTFLDLIKGARFLFTPVELDEKARMILNPEGKFANAQSLAILTTVESWRAPEIESVLKTYVNDHGLKLGKLAQPLRAALTGTTTSPGIFDVLEVLGREESLARIKDQSA